MMPGKVNMREWVSSSVAVLLLIQAVSGWCWQPSRDCGGCGAAMAMVSQPCCDGHGCDKGQEEEPQAPCQHESECHGFCTYLLPDKAEIRSPDLVASLDFVGIDSATWSTLPLGTVRWSLAGPRDSRLPLRLHLYYQILLI
jgi:hypothetical protein